MLTVHDSLIKHNVEDLARCFQGFFFTLIKSILQMFSHRLGRFFLKLVFMKTQRCLY